MRVSTMLTRLHFPLDTKAGQCPSVIVEETVGAIVRLRRIECPRGDLDEIRVAATRSPIDLQPCVRTAGVLPPNVDGWMLEGEVADRSERTDLLGLTSRSGIHAGKRVLHVPRLVGIRDALPYEPSAIVTLPLPLDARDGWRCRWTLAFRRGRSSTG